MIGLGVLIVVICGGVLIATLCVQEWVGSIVVGVILIIGITCINWDINSPIETTEIIVRTNEPQRYGINIIKDEEELVTIKVIKKNSIRFGAISGDSNQYSLILEEK